MLRSRASRRDPHAALLIIDMINAFDFPGAKAMLPRAVAAARAVAALKRRARTARMPVVYVNDNFRANFYVLFTAHDAYCATIGSSCRATAWRR